MKFVKRVLSILLVLASLFALVPSGISAKGIYNDVNESDWFYEYVMYVHEKGLMKGTGNGNFSPKVTTNRAMLVTILHRLEGEPKTIKEMPFTDVAEGQWYTDAIAWASAEGVVKGSSATTFNPEGLLTREQAAQIFYNYAKYKGYYEISSGNLSKFSDKAAISSWAEFAMNWSVGIGLINGTGNAKVSPKMTASRDQMATLLMNFCEKIAADAKVLYNINFMYNDGSNAVYTNSFSHNGAKLTKPADPERIGYTFNGWYTDNACTEKYNFSSKVTKSFTLYAGWISNTESTPNSSMGGGTDYTISDVELVSNGIKIYLNVNSKSLLKVEVLNESENKILETISVETPDYCELGEILLPPAKALPEYFVIKAYLYDLNSNLLDSFKCIKYTENYAKFEAQTVDSFPGERVLSFSDNKNTNFGVLNDNVKEITVGTSSNTFQKETKWVGGIPVGPDEIIYIFRNPNSSVSSLQAGDCVYVQGNGVSEMFKIERIEKTEFGTVIMYPCAESSIGDFYTVLKIDSGATNAYLPLPYSMAKADTEVDIHQYWKSDISTSFELGNDVKFKGSLTGSIEAEFSLVYDFKLFGKDYMSCSASSKVETEAKAELVRSSSGDYDLDQKDEFADAIGLTPFYIPTPVPGLNVYAEISVPFEWKIEAGGSITAKTVAKSGFYYDTVNGRKDIDEKSRSIELSMHGKAEFKIGPKAELGICYLGETAKANVNVQAGLKFEVKTCVDLYTAEETNADYIHSCTLCIEGKATWFITAKAELSYNILNTLKGKPIDATLFEITGNVVFPDGTDADFYCSVINAPDSYFKGKMSFGGGSCPNRKYRVTINTLDCNGKPMLGNTVTVYDAILNYNVTKGASPLTTYLYKGLYTASFVFDGITVDEAFIIEKKPVVLNLKISLEDLSVYSDEFVRIITETEYIWHYCLDEYDFQTMDVATIINELILPWPYYELGFYNYYEEDPIIITEDPKGIFDYDAISMNTNSVHSILTNVFGRSPDFKDSELYYYYNNELYMKYHGGIGSLFYSIESIEIEEYNSLGNNTYEFIVSDRFVDYVYSDSQVQEYKYRFVVELLNDNDEFMWRFIKFERIKAINTKPYTVIKENVFAAGDIQPTFDGFMGQGMFVFGYSEYINGNNKYLIDYNGNIVANPSQYGLEFCSLSLTYTDHGTKSLDPKTLEITEALGGHGGRSWICYDPQKGEGLAIMYGEAFPVNNIEYAALPLVKQIYAPNELTGQLYSYEFINEYALIIDNKIVHRGFDNGIGFDINGIVALSKNGKWGYYNNEGVQILPHEYSTSSHIYNNYNTEKEYTVPYSSSCGYIALNKNGKWGYADLKGNIVTDFEFDEARPVYMGKAWVKIDGAWSVIAFENYDSGIDKNIAKQSVKDYYNNINTAYSSITLVDSNYSIYGAKAFLFVAKHKNHDEYVYVLYDNRVFTVYKND